MRAVVQRVLQAQVTVGGESVGAIGPGLVVLLGVEIEDQPSDVDYLADKIVGLRIFEDEEGKMNRSLVDLGAEMLVVSQFTLLGDARKGKRPSFIRAAGPDLGHQLYESFVERVRSRSIRVETGRFRAMMDVALVNHGPVTLLLDSRKTF